VRGHKRAQAFASKKELTMNEPLPSWNDNATKQAILDFIQAVTDPNSPSFVPPAERITTFDNDGTLWLEKPLYIQLQFGLHAIGKMAAGNPELRERQPFKAVYEMDMAWLNAVAAGFATGDMSGVMTLMAGYLEAYDGIPVEEFDAAALEFMNNAHDPRFKKPYKLLTYQPMVELVHALQQNDFQVYITTAGGRDFVRAVCEEIYNIPRSMTIGSSVTFQYVEDNQGVAQILRTHEVEQPIDDGPGKPPQIHRSIGRRPIMAAGNSNGDIHMLKYVTGQPRRTLGLLVHHDDSECEYAYDEGAEKALLLSPQEGWLVVSMKNDWKTVFRSPVLETQPGLELKPPSGKLNFM
jgi:phosphoserine phosphatase